MQAAEAHRTLALARKDVKPSINCASLDALLKSYYTLDALQPGRNSIFSALGKDKFRGSSYGLASGVALGLDGWLPKEKQDMSRIVDEDVEKPIKTRSSKEYRDNWDATFGESTTVVVSPPSDGIEAKITAYMWHCHTCNAYVSDPENHQHHALIKIVP